MGLWFVARLQFPFIATLHHDLIFNIRQAWQKLGAMPPEEAMEKYIEIVTQLYPTWLDGGVVESFFPLIYFYCIASVSPLDSSCDLL